MQKTESDIHLRYFKNYLFSFCVIFVLLFAIAFILITCGFLWYYIGYLLCYFSKWAGISIGILGFAITIAACVMAIDDSDKNTE